MTILAAHTVTVYGSRSRFMVLPAADRPDMLRLTQRQPDWTLDMKATEWVDKVVTYNSTPRVEERLALPTTSADGEAYPPPTYLSHKPVRHANI